MNFKQFFLNESYQVPFNVGSFKKIADRAEKSRTEDRVKFDLGKIFLVYYTSIYQGADSQNKRGKFQYEIPSHLRKLLTSQKFKDRCTSGSIIRFDGSRNVFYINGTPVTKTSDNVGRLLNDLVAVNSALKQRCGYEFLSKSRTAKVNYDSEDIESNIPNDFLRNLVNMVKHFKKAVKR